MPADYYVAAGGIIRRGDEVLLLYKPQLKETVLPKGHVEAGETWEQAAVREAQEETGYGSLRVVAALGEPLRAEFMRHGRWTVRDEMYYLMDLLDETPADLGAYDDHERDRQLFERRWVPLRGAAERLTYEPARTFMRRAEAVAAAAPQAPTEDD